MLITAPRCTITAMLGPATKLLVADEGERGAKLFVLDDRSLRDLANLVEGPIRQFDAAVTDREPTIRIIDDGDPFADRRLGLLARLQNEHYLVVLQGQCLSQGAFFLPGKGVVEIVAGARRPVQILVVRRRFGKARVIVGHESREEGIASRQSCGTRQA